MKKSIFLLLFSVGTASAVMRTIPPTKMIRLPHVAPTAGVNTLIDGDGEKVAGCARADYTMSISSIVFFTQTITTGGRADYSIQTETSLGSATPGIPSGSYYCADSSGSYTFVGTEDNVALAFALPSNCTIQKGDGYCIVFEKPSGVGSTFNGQIIMRAVSDIMPLDQFAVVVTSVAAAAYTKLSFNPNIPLVDSNQNWVRSQGVNVTSSYTATNYNTASAHNVRGNAITFPVNTLVYGYAGIVDNEATFKLNVYDGSTIIDTIEVSSGVRTSVNSTNFELAASSGPWVALANKKYRIAMSAVATVSIGINETCSQVGADGAYVLLDSYPIAYSIVAKDPTGDSSWVERPRCYYPLSFIVTGIDDGGGGYSVSQ